MLIKEIYGHRARNGDVGIEIEVESQAPWPADFAPPAPWTAHVDNSLRHYPLEFVTSGPIAIEDVKGTVENLCKKIGKFPLVENCPRTSVHVHVNCTKRSFIGVLNAATCYWLLEGPLVTYCGEDREGNLFCLRLKDAEAILPMLEGALDRMDPRFGDRYRYAGCNLAAVAKYGTLEFRTMRGTTDASCIANWATELNNLVNEASKFPNPEALFDRFIEEDKKEFLGRFFSKDFIKKITSHHRWQDQIDESAALLCPFVYSRDWDEWLNKITRYYKGGEVKKKNRTPFGSSLLSNTIAVNVAPGPQDNAQNDLSLAVPQPDQETISYMAASGLSWTGQSWAFDDV